jgi:hypothetical protein
MSTATRKDSIENPYGSGWESPWDDSLKPRRRGASVSKALDFWLRLDQACVEAWEHFQDGDITFTHDFPGQRHVDGLRRGDEPLVDFTVTTPEGFERLTVTKLDSRPTIRNTLIHCVKAIKVRAKKRQAAVLPYR